MSTDDAVCDLKQAKGSLGEDDGRHWKGREIREDHRRSEPNTHTDRYPWVVSLNRDAIEVIRVVRRTRVVRVAANNVRSEAREIHSERRR